MLYRRARILIHEGCEKKTLMSESFWTVGDVVRKLRERRGWTQADLASAAGVDKSTIVRLEEGGDRTEPPTLKAVATALDVSVVRLHQLAAGVPPTTQELLQAVRAQDARTKRAVTRLLTAPKLATRRVRH